MATIRDLPALIRRKENMSYENFNVSVYCPVGTIDGITDFEEYKSSFRKISDYVKVGHVYIENLRDQHLATEEQISKVKSMFEEMGIRTSGGITTCAADGKKDGFISICYSDEKELAILKEAVEMNARLFDEFIFDDFFFSNCRCKKCIANKGSMSWSEFRLQQRQEVAREYVMKPAKAINPDVNVIIKFPQWFEDFNETGYDLVADTEIFDTIYTGTETRNPTYSAQHLPKYLSYFTMRLYGSNKDGVNLGGWFDPFECTYNITSYLEQAYLTLFSKIPEATVFCNMCFTHNPMFSSFAPALGAAFSEMDTYLGQLGNPVGVMAYHPSYGRGENNLHSYLGQCGIPMEPCLTYPTEAKDVFLDESAADDPNIVELVKNSLMNGANVTVTSGFVRKLGDVFEHEFVNIRYTTRKVLSKTYCVSWNHGVGLGGKYYGSKEIIIPQLEYCTNDCWEMAGVFGTDNNFPIVLRLPYADGNLAVVTIPDDMGDLYNYPRQVLDSIRDLFYQTSQVKLSAPGGVQLFLYDNDTAIIRSDLEYTETVALQVPDGKTKVIDLMHNIELPVTPQSKQFMEEIHNEIVAELAPGINYVIKFE